MTIEIKDSTRPENKGKTLEYLKNKYSEVMTTNEMQEKYTVQGFSAPIVSVIRKADNVSGYLEFTHNPRYYFNFFKA